MAKQLQKRTVSLSFAVFLFLLGIVAGILGAHYVGSNYYKAGLKTSLSGKYPKQQQQCDAVTITTPTKGQQVTSPLTVTAIVENANKQCQWTVFEGQAASMELKNESGIVIGTGLLTTDDNWMTDQAVTYQGDILFDETQATPRLLLILNEDDPSGQSQQKITLPLTY